MTARETSDGLVEIDGSLHAGSGSIVRQAVVYAALTGTAIRVTNARARRPHPGLRPQHTRAVEAVRDLVGGTLEGATVRSRSFTFRPGPIAPSGHHRWDIGTAGSATTLALAVLPLVAFRGRGVELEVHGGLFQDFAPSPFHLQFVLLPLLARMGLAADIELVRPGYVPAGEGILRLVVPPATTPLRPLVLDRAGAVRSVRGVALASHLEDRRVSARMATAARTTLASAGLDARIEQRNDTTARQPGAALALYADLDGGVLLGADRAGAPHRRAERIGTRVAHQLLDEIHSHATLDRFASDQILPFTALATGQSTFRVPFLTEHLATGAWLASLFLGTDVRVTGTTVVIARRGEAPRAGVDEAAPGGRG
ncbi:MAG TPA: RNA 3'-terminal phosphate cyclase [Acidimicrobiales bacterium]|nr:RNA 3'-terminal phosphate cyclase [Acidimicrobiales bacterium]